MIGEVIYETREEIIQIRTPFVRIYWDLFKPVHVRLHLLIKWEQPNWFNKMNITTTHCLINPRLLFQSRYFQVFHTIRDLLYVILLGAVGNRLIGDIIFEVLFYCIFYLLYRQENSKDSWIIQRHWLWKGSIMPSDAYFWL